MKKWTMAFFVCLELLSNAVRSSEPKQLKVLTKKVTTLESPGIDDDLFSLAA